MRAKIVLRSALAAIPVVVGVTVITFLLMHSTAGSYLPGLSLNPNLTGAQVQLLRSQLGLDQSMVDGTSVSSQVFERLPNTMLLTVTAILVGILLSIPLGVIAAVRRGT